MTAQELLQYRNDPYRQELVNGMLHEMQPPGAEHGLVAMRIAMLLAAHVQARNLGLAFAGEIGFQLASSPDTVRAPHTGFISRTRIPATGIPAGYWPGPPDLAIEVVSPNDRHGAVESQGPGLARVGSSRRSRRRSAEPFGHGVPRPRRHPRPRRRRAVGSRRCRARWSPTVGDLFVISSVH